MNEIETYFENEYNLIINDIEALQCTLNSRKKKAAQFATIRKWIEEQELSQYNIYKIDNGFLILTVNTPSNSTISHTEISYSIYTGKYLEKYLINNVKFSKNLCFRESMFTQPQNIDLIYNYATSEIKHISIDEFNNYLKNIFYQKYFKLDNDNFIEIKNIEFAGDDLCFNSQFLIDCLIVNPDDNEIYHEKIRDTTDLNIETEISEAEFDKVFNTVIKTFVSDNRK